MNISELLKSGYSINQAINFLARVDQNKKIFQIINEKIKNGSKLSEALQKNINPNILMQIQMAENNGQLADCLRALGKYLDGQYQQLHKVKQVSRYPILLLVILVFMIVVAKYFLYPIFDQWDSQAFDNSWINYLISGTAIIGMLLVLIGVNFLRKSKINRLSFMVRLPLVGKIVKTMINYQIANHLSLAFDSGLEFGETVNLYSDNNSKLTTTQLARQTKNALNDGYDIEHIVSKLNFIDQSLVALFQKGADNFQIASDFKQYSNFTFKKMMKQIDQLVNIIQPFLFGIIGLAIIGMYLMMLMPMYQTIGGLYK